MKQILLLCTIISLVLAVEQREARYRIEPYVIGSVNNIVGASAKSWELSSTFGFGVRFPVVNVPLNVSLSFNIGKVEGVEKLPEFGLLLTSFLLEYEHQFHEHFHFIAGAGVANMLITAGDEMEINKPFAGESENEFGLAIAVEPKLCIRKFSLGLRIQDRHIYSAPKSVNIISLSLIGGWRF